MKRLPLLSLLLLAALITATSASAYVSPGSPTGFVNDFAGVLSAETKQSLEAQLVQFEASTTNEIAVAILPSMQGDYVENVAEKLFQEWGVGKADKDNGVLLLVALEERELRIEVGYGLEGALPDSLAGRIIEGEIVPHLKEGNYDAAVSAGVQAIMQATQGEYQGAGIGGVDFDIETFFYMFVFFPMVIFPWIAAVFARSKSWWAGGIVGALIGLGVGYYLAVGVFFIALFAFGLGLFGLILDFIVSTAYKEAKSSGGTTPWWAGGGHTGSGGGGFGGGSSGGGGASGRW